MFELYYQLDFLNLKKTKVFYKVNKLKDKTKQLEHLSWYNRKEKLLFLFFGIQPFSFTLRKIRNNVNLNPRGFIIESRNSIGSNLSESK